MTGNWRLGLYCKGWYIVGALKRRERESTFGGIDDKITRKEYPLDW